jgi:multiple sugar transport system permease protein
MSDSVVRPRRPRPTVGRIATYLAGFTLVFWILFPIWFLFSMAFTTREEVRSFPKGVLPFVPFSTDTMRFFLGVDGVLSGLVNSLIVAVITVVLSTVISAPAGYAISRYVFPGRDAFRLGVLAVRAFPVVVLSIPLAVLFIRVNLFDNILSVALMHTILTLPTTILVIASVFASVPYELEEAGQVFGASPWKSFRYIVLPLVVPGIAAASVLTFVLSWNEVFAASVLTLENRTLPALLLNQLSQSGPAYQFAGGFFLMVPSLIFMFVIRKYLFNMWGQVSK